MLIKKNMKNNKKILKKFVTQSSRPLMKPTVDKEVPVVTEETTTMTMMISIMRTCDQVVRNLY